MTVFEGICHLAFDATRWSVTSPPVLAEGVRGYTALLRDDLWITMVVSEPRGQGHMGAYIDSLITAADAFTPKTRIIVTEPNEIMRDMLARRGFRPDLFELPPEAPFEEIVRAMVYGGES